ncbi:MAG: hypothetical protein K0S25_736 [Bacillus sp. (in: firmicutes)]|nr:hypothetical protein [Bacillus sp. (in: firmicutes)]
MNIQQYYRSAATVSLNGSLAAFVPVIIILVGSILFSVHLPLLYVMIPFCVYSCICYQVYLIQHQRCLETEITETQVDTTLEKSQNILITFMPAPSLRMLLFEPNGFLIGEVRDFRFWWFRWFLPYFADKLIPNVYGLYDQQNKLLALYSVNQRKKQVKIMDSVKNEIGIYHEYIKPIFSLEKRGTIHSLIENHYIQVEGSSLYPHIKFRNEEDFIIGKLIKGWMPLNWGKQFRDANTPFIVLEEQVDVTDKIFMVGVLAYFFKCTSH